MTDEALLQLALLLGVGRLVLSLLPPGWPGYHDRSELGATLTASLLLGRLGLAVVPWWWVWLVVLLARLVLLPGALRPGYPDRRGGIGWLLVFLLCLAAGSSEAPLGITLEAVVLAGAGWWTWRTRADRRARALVVLAVLTPFALTFL